MGRSKTIIALSIVVVSVVSLFAGCQQISQPFIDSGNANVTGKNYDQALSDFNRAITIDPGSAQAYAGRARAYNIQKQYDLAITDLNKAIELDPNLAIAYYRRGVAYGAKEMGDQAIADYTRAAELKPDMANAYSMRAGIYGNRKDYEKAIAGYSKAIELAPTFSGYYYWRGWCYQQLKQYDRALADFTKYIETDNKTASSYSSRAMFYFDMKQLGNALSDFSRAVELDSNNAQRYLSRAYCLVEMKKYDEAIADYKTALQMNPEDMDSIYGGLSLCYERKKDYASAIATCTEAIRNNPQSALNYNNRGYIYVLTGDYEKALPDINTSLELATDNNSIWAYLDSRGWYYYKTGNIEMALSDLSRSLDLHPDNVVYSHRAQAYIAVKEHEKALADLNKSIALNNEYAEAYYYRGLVYKALGQAETAIADFQSAAKFSDDDSITKLVTGELIGLPSTSESAAEENVSFMISSSHFVKNTYSGETNPSYLLIRNYSSFESLFGIAAVMGMDSSKLITEEKMERGFVISIIYQGNDIHKFDIEKISLQNNQLQVYYTSEVTQSNASWTCNCHVTALIDNCKFDSILLFENRHAMPDALIKEL